LLIDEKRLIFFGVGKTAQAVAYLAQGSYKLFGTTRNANKQAQLTNSGIEAVLLKMPSSESQNALLHSLVKGANLLVTFPPDGHSDKELAAVASDARRIIYISSTGVYGRRTGVIDESIDVDSQSDDAALRVNAESIWRGEGAIVLRAPALYSRASGLHIRLRNGTYRMAGDGSNYTSRIHIKDLARLIIAAFEKPLDKASTFVVGDLKPAPQRDVVTWLCGQMNLPIPAAVPLSEVPSHLQSNRCILPNKILSELGVKLDFPTYIEGFRDCLQ
jgi:hypothetical protein